MNVSNQTNEVTDDIQQDVKLATALTPVAINERIEAIDVVRGFALIGIFFMNIEWFNRLEVDFSMGIPASVSGIDWAAHYFVNFFVAGKFWTIFSLLFGVGFAVMLTRSEDSGRAFIVPYIRRIIALGIFGAIHQIFLWSGDILLSYAFTASGLMVVLFGTWKWVVGFLVGFVGITMIPGMGSFGILIGGLSYMGILALYYRSEKRVSMLGHQISLFSLILGILALCALVFAIVSFFVPSMRDSAVPALVGSLAFLVTAVFSAVHREPASLRLLRGGIWIYLTPFVIGLVVMLMDINKPYSNVFDNVEAVRLADKKQLEKAEKERIEKAQKLTGKTSAPEKMEGKKEEFNKEKKKLNDDAERIVRIRESQEKAKVELAAMTSKNYADFFQFRLNEFKKDAFNAAVPGFLAIAMFMIGVWSFRSGIISKVKENLPLFRRLALFGLPLGWGLSILASMISLRSERGIEGDHFGLAMTILEIANLPACIAYISVVVVALYSKSIFSNVRLLAPYGRMALTNYLSQSLIQATFFYGWGFCYFGMGRAAQLGFAVCVIIFQIIFSHLWLSKFRYGPLEWLWRAGTYWKWPAFRI